MSLNQREIWDILGSSGCDVILKERSNDRVIELMRCFTSAMPWVDGEALAQRTGHKRTLCHSTFQIHGQSLSLLIGHLQLERFSLLCSPTLQDCSVGQNKVWGLIRTELSISHTYIYLDLTYRYADAQQSIWNNALTDWILPQGAAVTLVYICVWL